MKGVEEMKSHNILIVSASIGSGHTQAANAVREELLRRSPTSQITVVDFLEGSPWLGLVKETYLKMLDLLPNVYDFLYHHSQGPYHGSKVNNFTALVMKTKLLGLLRRYRPDSVIFTHPFPCCAAAYLRRTKRIRTPLHAIITDFAVHRLWVHNELDLYFAANDEVVSALRHMGIANDRIHETGIPISAKFTNMPRNHGDSPEPVVLIMGGGLGLGSVEKAVAQLSALKSKVRIIVITGKNSTLQDRLISLKKHSPHPIEIIGYTHRVHEFMAQASILLTKPGALTCSEALAMQLPLVLIDPIPGQEEENSAYLVRHGAAVITDTDDRLVNIVSRLLMDTEKTNAMCSKALSMARPHAAADIADSILSRLSDTCLFPMQAS
jgi:processive 1,2-diacylglycerol beta-glucosyltransferase